MSKARGLITGGDFESRSSGMYDSVDNVRIAAISQAGLKKVGSQQTNLYTTGMSYSIFICLVTRWTSFVSRI